MASTESNVAASIYALSDPRNPGLIRYIGRTDGPIEARLKKHINTTENCKNFHYPVARWIAKLKEIGLSPIAFLIEACSKLNAPERETYWIRFFRPAGILLNQSDGAGTLGMRCFLTDETRKKISDARRGKPMSKIQKEAWLSAGGFRWDEIKKAITSKCGTLKFKSLTEASSYLGVCVQAIARAVSNEAYCCGLKWDYCTPESVTGHKNPSSISLIKINPTHLSKEIVSEVRNLHGSGLSQRLISESLSINQSTVSRIIKGRAKPNAN